MQTYHTKLQMIANELKIDGSQIDNAHRGFSANQTRLQNKVRALRTTDIKFCTTDIKFRTSDIKFGLIQTKFQSVHTKL